MFVFAPGFADNPDKYDLAVSMLRLTFPYVLFISLVACAGGILNSFSRFAIPAFPPVLLNLCLIAFSSIAQPNAGSILLGTQQQKHNTVQHL